MSLPRRLLLVALVMLGTMMVLEAVASVYLHALASDESFRELATALQLQASGKKQLLVQRHPYLGYSLNPGYENGQNRVNSLGFRGEEFPLVKEGGEFRIVCLGGSTTFGGGISDNASTYPAQLQSILRGQGHAKVRVINGGVPGYTTFESLANLQYRVPDLEPDLIIVYHAINDILTRLVWPPEAYRSDNSAFRRPSEQIFMPPLWEYSTCLRIAAIRLGVVKPHSQLDRMFGGRGDAFVGFEGALRGQPNLSEMLEANAPIYYESNLQGMVDSAKRRGADTLLMTFVHAPQLVGSGLGDPAVIASAFEEMNAVMRRLAGDEGVYLFDLTSSYTDRPELFSDFVHMNEEGCRVQAELLAEYLSVTLGDELSN